LQKTSPHDLQWCFVRNSVKDLAQVLHILADSSGTHFGSSSNFGSFFFFLAPPFALVAMVDELISNLSKIAFISGGNIASGGFF